ncbi:MAG: TetR/AcrR family transcriptional regulator [Anaerolineales bacterium]|nr:TetR/AcrR family transcriptional regulator [Anaerolineales bacterium]
MQRAEIIQAAAQIFRQKGYHGTSMQDIADAVGLKKASLYHHVSGKQDILLSILDQALDLLIQDMQTVLNQSLPAEEKIRQAMQVYVRRLTEDPDLSAVLLMEHRSLEDDLQEDHIARRDRFEALWRAIIDEGSRAGSFRQMNSSLATFAVLGVLNWMITWYRPNGRLRAEKIADQFADLVLGGLLVGIDE